MPEPLPATCLAAPTEARAPSASARRDVALVRRILAAQSAAAHAELLRLYYRPVCRYVRQRVRPADAAEDLTMEIFPLGTVKARLFRCRQLLVELLAAERE